MTSSTESLDFSIAGYLIGAGVGDNTDTFPNDPSESVDTDGDGVGDNSDVFPNDPMETKDSDGDGIGDNVDPNTNTGGNTGGTSTDLSGDNDLTGTANEEIIVAGAGNDTLTGLAGDDRLYGGADNDTYIIGANNGKDTIVDTDGVNTIRFIDGIGFNDVASGLSRSGDDLLLNIGGNTTNQVRVANFFSLANTIERLEFENGSTITAAQLYGAFGAPAPTATAETFDMLSAVLPINNNVLGEPVLIAKLDNINSRIAA